MLSLIETIKRDQLEARKARDGTKSTVLTTLIGEAVMIGKNDGNRESTDFEVLNVIKKFIKNIDETLSLIPEEAAAYTRKERAVLEAYLPYQYSVKEILVFLQGREKNKGMLMKYLKENHSGYYDGKTASEAVDAYINAPD